MDELELHHIPLIRLKQLQIESERSEMEQQGPTSTILGSTSENLQEKSVIQQQRKPGKRTQKKKKKGLLGTVSTDQGQDDSEKREVASKAINDVTHIKRTQKKEKKGLLGTVSTDQGQDDSEKWEVASKAINDVTHIKRSQKEKDRQRTMSKDQCETHHDQQDSKTIGESKDPQLKEGLGRPIIKATLCRFTSPSLTVFLTMEDLEFVLPHDGCVLKIEKISYDHESPDAKAQQRRAESYQPLRVVDDTDLFSKKDWIERSNVWNLADDVIKSQLKAEKGALSIHICGIPGKGYGAILRDYRYFPVVARNCSDVDGSMSTFYSRLNGVALGVRIALDYELSRFSINVPSLNLCNFMRHIWEPNVRNGKRKSNQVGKRLVGRHLPPEAMCDFENVCSLANAIIKDLDQVRRKGITVFHVEPVLSIYNQAAEFLANLSSDNDNMKPAAILENEQLSEILYDDAVR